MTNQEPTWIDVRIPDGWSEMDIPGTLFPKGVRNAISPADATTMRIHDVSASERPGVLAILAQVGIQVVEPSGEPKPASV